MSRVGRPPEVDSEGNPIQKSLVNVTIPSKLANFLKEKGINRSKLFTETVKKLYKKELCPRCYDQNIIQTPVGVKCEDCNQWLTLNNCPNCSERYQPGYNMFSNSNDLIGCWSCIPPEKRL
jgi:hypothetical protein